MRDRLTQKPRGFGFVTFRDASVADGVTLEEAHCIGGKEVDVKKSVAQESKHTVGKIFVGGLAPETTEGEMKEYFSQFGSVSEVQIMLDHLSGRSRGFGFVTFEGEESAYAVFTRGLIHIIRGKHVEVKPATPKGSGSNRSSMDGSSSDWAGSPEYTQQLNSFYSTVNQASYGSPYGMYAPHVMGGRGMRDQQSAMIYSAMYQQQAPHNGMMPYMFVPQGYMAGSPAQYASSMSHHHGYMPAMQVGNSGTSYQNTSRRGRGRQERSLQHQDSSQSVKQHKTSPSFQEKA